MKEIAFEVLFCYDRKLTPLLLRCPIFCFTSNLMDRVGYMLGPTSPMSHIAANAKSCKNRQSGAAFTEQIVNTNNLLALPTGGQCLIKKIRLI